MRSIFRKALSVALSVLMFSSVAVAPASANCGKKEMVTFEEACEKRWNDELGEIDTVRYLFYMPDQWKNKYNDYYDGTDPSTYSAGIYWWSGSALPDEFNKGKSGCNGYALTEKVDGNNNIFVADVPADVEYFIFNNSVYGGLDTYAEEYQAFEYTEDILVNGYEPYSSKYGYYPNGLESMADMIYVCDPNAGITTSKYIWSGEWFYYYGNGEYGFAPTREEAGNYIYCNGEFPLSGLLPVPSTTIGVGGTYTTKLNRFSATAISENEKIATVTKVDNQTFSITGVSAGNTRILFEYYNTESQETKRETLCINVIEPSFDEAEITMEAGEFCDNPMYGMGENAVISYSQKGIVEYDGYSAYGLKCGNSTVTVTQGNKAFSFDVKVNHKITKSNKKATYFADGYKNRKTCTICKKVLSKGTTDKKCKLKTPNAKISSAKKKLSVKYTKVKDATGFRVKYKIGKKSFTKSFNTKKTVTKTIKNLKKGSYKVYVQAFVKQGKKIAYSNWSKAKTVKIK